MTTVIAAYEVAEGGTALDPALYSRYKYGSRDAVDTFADILADLAPAVGNDDLAVTAPASRAVPIGADLLADGVLRVVNHARALKGVRPAVRPKLHRHAVPAEDYGARDAAGRRELLARERISGIPDLFRGRDVVIVDDLWVTGASAEVTVDAVSRYAPRSVTYLVIATVEPGYAARRPEVEHDLNHAAIHDLPTLAGLCRTGPVTVNQRFCKFVLRQGPESVTAWLAGIPDAVAWELYSAVLAEGFPLEPGFAATARAIVGEADRRNLDA